MNVLANETQQDKSKEKESNAHNIKNVKKFNKEFIKNISSKISKNRLLMSHILLRNSLNTNFTKADLFDDDISIKGFNYFYYFWYFIIYHFDTI